MFPPIDRPALPEGDGPATAATTVRPRATRTTGAAAAASVMSAYNKVNDVYCGEHRELLSQSREAGFVRLRVDGAIVALEGLASGCVPVVSERGGLIDLPGNGPEILSHQKHAEGRRQSR